MVIEKKNNDYGTFNINIVNGDRKLSIFQSGADYTFGCKYLDYRRISDIDFMIPNDDILYPLFDSLYTSIISGDVLGEGKSDKESLEKYASRKRYTAYQSLVSDDTISYASDATPIKVPNILKIIKTEEGILLVFTSINDKDFPYPKNPFSIDVEVRQSGSRYDPFHIPFNHLFKKLQSISDTKEKVAEYQKQS